MTDRAALLAGILAAPDDDAPRLVFADWLDEYGEPERAEFIRVQRELARTDETLPPGTRMVHDTEANRHQALPSGVKWTIAKPGEPYHGVASSPVPNPRYLSLRRRERALMTVDNLTQWSGIGRPITEPNWRCGFVETIDAISAADWLTHADAITAEHPLRTVTLTTWPEELRFHRVDTSRGETFYIFDRWPAIKFHLPNIRMSRNVGTYEEPIWEPADPVADPAFNILGTMMVTSHVPPPR